jgi:hydrogenase expression/formation protein HypC
MCITLPARVTALGGDGTVTVLVNGRLVRVALLGVDEAVGVGDWLLVHSGIALGRLDETEAAQRFQLFEEAT